MEIKNKLEIAYENSPTTPLITMYTYDTGVYPFWTFEELEGWRGFTIRERVNTPDPNGGSYVDKYSTPQSKIISVIINVILGAPSQEFDVEQLIEQLVEEDELLRLTLTTTYPDKEVVQYLSDCFFTDVSPAVREKMKVTYAFTLTSKNYSLSTPAVTEL